MRVAHAALFALCGYQERSTGNRHQRHACAGEQGIKADRLVVVERHALVHLEPRLVEPAEASDVHGLQRAVAPVRQPFGREEPDEKQAGKEERYW